MDELIATDFYGTVTWVGLVDGPQKVLATKPQDSLKFDLDGIVGEFHHGSTRQSCVRVKDLYPIGTTIRNTRQITILSAENLAEIARDMGADKLDPKLLGANIVVEGIPDFTHVPPSSRLQAGNGTVVVVDRINLPCLYPAKAVEKDQPGMGEKFKPAAAGRRGVTAWVEREGTISIGDVLRLHIPNQRSWAALAAAGAADAV